jgi:hypothetical protein
MREEFLRAEGFEVVRIGDAEVISNDGEAFARIERAVLKRLRTPPLAPPQEGEGDAALEVQVPTPTPPHKGEGGAGAEAASR